MPIPPVSDSAPTGPAPAEPVPDRAPPKPAPAEPVSDSAPARAPAEPVPDAVEAPPRIVAPPRIGALPIGVAAPPRPVVHSAARGLGSGEVLGLVALYTAVLVVHGLVLGSGAPIGWSVGPFQAMLIGQILAGALVLGLGLRWSGLTFADACPTALPAPGALPALVLAGLGLGLLLCEITRSAPGWVLFDPGLLPFVGPKAGVVAGGLSVIVVAPVLEELVFRGLLLHGLRRRHSPTFAATASAIVFALYHLDPWQMAAAFGLGLGLAWLTLGTRSVLPAILVHALINATGLVDSPLVPLLGYGPLELATMMHLPATVLLLAGAAAIVGCVLLWRGLPSWKSGKATSPAPLAAPPPEILRVAITIAAAFALLAVAQRELRRLPTPTPPPDEGCYRAGIPSAVAAALFPGDTAAMPRIRLTRAPYLVGLQVRPKYLALPFDSATADAARRTGRVMYWTPAADGLVILGRLPTGRTIFLLLTRQSANLAGEITYSRDAAAAGSLLGDAIFLTVSCTGEEPPPAVPTDEEPLLDSIPTTSGAAEKKTFETVHELLRAH